MANYRLYNLNPSSGHIDWVDEIDAADDVEAVAIARALPREVAVELWYEGRKVLRLERPANVSFPSNPLREHRLRSMLAG